MTMTQAPVSVEAPKVAVSDLAAEKRAEVLAEEGQPEAALRVIVVPNGHGAQYMLSLEDAVAEDDLALYESSGVRVIADADSAPLLDGASIDYSEGLMRSGFVIENPNIAPAQGGGCGGGGCGGGCGGGGCGGGCGCSH